MNSKNIIYPLLFLAAFACALTGLNPTFYADDSPEFPAAAETLGIVHPPGYPLYTLLERLAALLPLPHCFRANLAAALLSALICVLLFNLLRETFHIPSSTSLVFSLFWMAGATSYPGALSAKSGLYVLTGVFLLSILSCLAGRKWHLASFLFGLSLGNHWMSMAAYSPGLLYLASRFSQADHWNSRRFVRSALWILLGLSPYLYLPLRASQAPLLNWGAATEWPLFLDHLNRTVDSGKDLAAQPSQWFRVLFYYFYSAIREFWGAGLLAIPGLILLFKKEKTWFDGSLLLLGGFVAAVSLFSKHSNANLHWISGYSISSMTLILLLSALGAKFLFSSLNSEKFRTRILPWGLGVLVISGLTARSLSAGQSHFTYGYDYVLNTWKALPRGSIFFCSGDGLEFSTWYLQWVEKKRTDLCYVGPAMYMDWFRAGLAKRYPDVKIPEPTHRRGETIWRQPLFRRTIEANRKKEIYFSDLPDPGEGLENINLSPLGLTLRAALPPDQAEFNEKDNRLLWSGFRFRGPKTGGPAEDPWTKGFLDSYPAARLWKARYEIRAAGDGTGPESMDWRQKSLEDFQWIYDWNPSNRESAMNLGGNYLLLGKTAEARSWIQKASGEIPADWKLFYDAGVLAYQAGNKILAAIWFKKSLAENPVNESARQALRQLEP